MENTNAQTMWIDVKGIEIPEHFREHSPEALEQLTEDIRQHGQLQEIVVAPSSDGRYELVAGKGRMMAMQKLGWEKIRAQVMTEVSEIEKAMISISENEEREDVSPIDKAISYKRAIDVGQMDQRELAMRRGVSEQQIGAYMALLDLAAPVLENYRRLEFSMGQLTQLIRVKNPEQQSKLAEICDKQGLSVKALRAQVDKLLSPQAGPSDKNDKEPRKTQTSGFEFKQKGTDLFIKGYVSMEGQTTETLVEAFRAAWEQYQTPQLVSQAA